MFDILKNKVMALGASAIAVGGTTALTSFVTTASYSDALGYYGWIEATQLSGAVPGQFYVISDQSEIREPLCSLAPGDFAPQESQGPGVRLVNVLGEALPSVLRVTGMVTGGAQANEPDRPAGWVFDLSRLKRSHVPVSSMLDHDRQILEERDIDALRKTLDDQQFAEVMRLESCANAIVTSLRQGLQVCQLTEVSSDAATGRPLGVEFASSCLARSDDTEPRHLPELRRYPLWTKVKKTLGLIEARFLPDGAAPAAGPNADPRPPA
jgi:hypothetical protein